MNYISRVFLLSMFYVAELLSLKNKTEISILYYLATAKKFRKLSKRHILAIDIPVTIREIEKSEVPFSLRLYGYLLRGVIRALMIKVEHYISCLKTVGREKHGTRTQVAQQKTRCHPNLVIEDEFIESIENDGLLDSVSEFASVQGYYEDIAIGADRANYSHHAHGSLLQESLSSLEEMRRAHSSGLSGEGPFRAVLTAERRRARMDKNCTLPAAELVCKCVASDCKSGDIPSLIDCFIVKVLERLSEHSQCKRREMKAKEGTEVGDANEAYNVFSSADDMRLSDIAEHQYYAPVVEPAEQHDQRGDSQEQERSKNAEWFYSILVEASVGRISVRQEEPFGALYITTTA